MQSSSCTEGAGVELRDDDESREARAAARDFSEEDAAVSGVSSVQVAKSNDSMCSNPDPQPQPDNNDEAGDNNVSGNAASIEGEHDEQRPDASDATKNISSSEETAATSANPPAESMSSAVTPSDDRVQKSDEAEFCLSEDSGRERCQSTSEHRPAPRAKDEDLSSVFSAAPEEPLTCTSSSNRTGSSPTQKDEVMAVPTDDDRDISSSNINTHRLRTVGEHDNEDVPESSAAGAEATSKDSDPTPADCGTEAEACSGDNKQHISSSQSTASPNSDDVNSALITEVSLMFSLIYAVLVTRRLCS